jgi:YVTN family beta-propeller protein
MFKAQIQPMFVSKREGLVRCTQCHGRGAGTGGLFIQPPGEGTTTWTDEQSRKNFDAVRRFVVPGNPDASRLLTHPLDRAAGGDPFHGGGKHWKTKDDAEWRTLAAWVRSETKGPQAPLGQPSAVRIIQTNAAGDNAHLIDPATNTVVGIIEDVEIVHGVTSSPDGRRIYLSNESLHTLDVIDAKTLAVTNRIHLSGRPNNVAITNDGRKVYVGIAQAPGALDVIDTQSLANVKSVPVEGSIHNVYVTPDGKYAVAGSIPSSTISIVDTSTDTMVRKIKMSSGIRPMTFDRNADGSTRHIYVQLSNFHGFAVVDFASGKELRRIEHPAVPGEHAHTDGLQGAPAHGLGVSPDGKTLWSTSKVYSHAYVFALPDLEPLGTVFVGQHPEWVTFTPDSRYVYVGAAGDNMTFAVDVQTRKEVARIPVGQVPKRVATAVLKIE